MTNARVSFRIRGRDPDGGDLRFEDFISQLASIKHALSETARIVSDRRSVYFRVVGLSHSSPASVVLEAWPLRQGYDPAPVVSAFRKGVELIQRGVAPEGFDYQALQAYREMTGLVGKEISEMVIEEDGQSIPITRPLAAKIDELLGADEYEMGSVTGFLDTINFHAGQRVFFVYPVGRQSKVRCNFPPEMRSQAIQALTHYVEVFGELKYKSTQMYPHEMLVRSIDILPPQEKLPKLADLKGISPEATDDLTSEEFVRRLRDEWQ